MIYSLTTNRCIPMKRCSPNKFIAIKTLTIIGSHMAKKHGNIPNLYKCVSWQYHVIIHRCPIIASHYFKMNLSTSQWNLLPTKHRALVNHLRNTRGTFEPIGWTNIIIMLCNLKGQWYDIEVNTRLPSVC